MSSLIFNLSTLSQFLVLSTVWGYFSGADEIFGLGITFKENCPDIRNSRVIDVINELKDFGTNVEVYDPWADSQEVEREYGISLLGKETVPDFSQYAAIVVAVAHDAFKALDLKANKQQVIYDIKSVLAEADATL